MNIDEELAKAGLTREQYEACMDDITDKMNGLNDMDWAEIQFKHNISLNPDGLRKANSRPFGGAFAKEYYSINKKKLYQFLEMLMYQVHLQSKCPRYEKKDKDYMMKGQL